MSVSSILNLLHELNRIILCEPLANIILFHSTSAINSVMNLHKFDILFITYPKLRPFKVKLESFFIDAPIV
jgi:hypothetical protein